MATGLGASKLLYPNPLFRLVMTHRGDSTSSLLPSRFVHLSLPTTPALMVSVRYFLKSFPPYLIVRQLPAALPLYASPVPVSAASSGRQLVSLQHKHPPAPQPRLLHVPLLHTLTPVSSPAPIVPICYRSAVVTCRCSPT